MGQKIAHESLRVNRDGVWGEYVYLSRWQALMSGAPESEDDGTPFENILSVSGLEADQRAAHVAATLAQWLGTNCGNGLIHQARALAKATFSLSDAFVGAWAMQNRRIAYRNDGVRSLELTLTPSTTPRSERDGIPETIPDLSVRDYEVAEAIVAWLGTESGQRFIAACEADIAALHAYRSRVWGHTLRSVGRTEELSGAEIRSVVGALREGAGVETLVALRVAAAA